MEAKKGISEILSEIESRCNASTPGPWEKIARSKFWGLVWPRDGHLISAGEATPATFRERDAEFIAHARTDVPRLLAALKKCREQRDKWIVNYTLPTGGERWRDELDAELAAILSGEGGE